MPEQTRLSLREFKGLRNDVDPKQMSIEYFTRMWNYNFPVTGLAGVEKILMPERVNQIGTACIDGLVEYKYVDANDQLVTEIICITDGKIYKDALTSETLLKSGLFTGKVSFATYQDKLFIANGRNYVNIYDGNLGVIAEMGAPFAKITNTSGNLKGTYSYKMTYVTAGGEEVIGSVSNTVYPVNNQVNLTLPIGYDGVTSRNVYRTEAGGSSYKLLVSIGDNTTLSYIDNIVDGSLTTDIPSVNNELPKPYHLTVAGQRLYATKDNKQPSKVFVTDVLVEVIDSANAILVSDYDNDNTRIQGIGVDFDKVLVGSEKQIYLINPTDNTVTVTRSNIGIKSGYTVTNVPAFEGFSGGLMFTSTLNDVRVMSGLQALPVSTSIDNVRTDNWAQVVRGSLEGNLKVATNTFATFYDYKYHLLVGNIKYVFDVRTKGWSIHSISTDSYRSEPQILAVIDNLLYNGQCDGWIEQEYKSIEYRSEDVFANVKSPQIAVSTDYKFLQKIVFWFTPSKSNTITINVTLDDNTNSKYQISKTFNFNGGVYHKDYYNPTYYLTDNTGMDYRVINVYRPCRYMNYEIINEVGNIVFEGFDVIGEVWANKEQRVA